VKQEPDSRGDRPNIFYINNNTSSTFGVPVHLQRYMLIDYCKARQLNYEFELFELEDMPHLPTLAHIVQNLNANLLMYSIFALPEDETYRNNLLEIALERGVIVRFVNEDLTLATAQDLKTINSYLQFSRYGDSMMPIGLPLSQHARQMFRRWVER
jgi:sporadic carbohydrate cluster protein (TIGR04323 family)